MASLLIKHGNIVNEGHTVCADLLIADGKIRAIGANLQKIDAGTRLVEASGMLVVPGGIDPHVHMALPVGGGLVSADDFQTGTAAALAGGTTTIIDFVTPQRDQSLMDAFEARKADARGSLCDYAFHMSLTAWADHMPAQMRRSVEAGMPSFKIYMAYKQAVGLDDDDILRVMDAAAKLKARVLVHCEHGETVDFLRQKFVSRGDTAPKHHPLSRPVPVEREAQRRALMMAEATHCPLYIVHDSIGGMLDQIDTARVDVAVETCPHYLVLDDSRYDAPGFAGAAYVMSPPLRPGQYNDILWQGIAQKRIHTVATDHCPFNMKGGKDRGLHDFTKIPNGVAGVEDRLAILYTYGVAAGKISVNDWVRITSTAPAKLFGLHPRKGVIAPGADADVLIWDPALKRTISAASHHQNCDTNIYEGMTVTGAPHMVIANGVVAYADNTLHIPGKFGNYLFRSL